MKNGGVLSLFCLFNLLGTIGGGAFSAQALTTLNDADAIVTDVDQAFRSSSRHVPAMDLFESSYQAIGSQNLKRLHQLSTEELTATLKRLREKLKINKGVAENLIKIHQFTQLCSEQKALTPTFEEQKCAKVTADSVSGLHPDQIDQLVSSFPSQTEKRLKEWDFKALEMIRLAMKDATDNDWYKFKMAAIIFQYGFHETKKVVYNGFSRGKDNRAFYVVGGTSILLDALPQFRFQEREIQYIMHHPQFKNVPKSFFEYLRTWRFKGNIRVVPDGTVVFANESIYEIETDPLSATLIECFVSPWIDAVTTSATKVARIVLAADGAPVVEGGTRRSGHGLLGAYGALVGMAAGTSNTKLSRILETLPYGSMEHAIFGLFPTELATHIAYNMMFPDSTHLIDENEIIEGIKLANRAAGSSMAGARTDSEIARAGLDGTTRMMQDLADALGIPELKILVSNRINEYLLKSLKPGVSAHKAILVGTEAQNPSDANGANMVYKLTEVTNLITGEVQPIAKASVGKVGIPGRRETFRVFKPVDPNSTESHLKTRAVEDVIAVKGEIIESGVPLLREGLREDGTRVLPYETPAQMSQRTATQLSAFGPEVLDVSAKAGAYLVRLSDELRKKQEAVIRQKQIHEYRVGVQIGSFDPVTEAHVAIAKRSKLLYTMDQFIVVPANQKPIHEKLYTFSAEERLAMAREKYTPLGIEVDDREIRTGNRYTLETLRELQKEVSSQHANAKLFVVVGYDLFAGLIDASGNSKWKKDQYTLLNEGYSWVVNVRGDQTRLDIPAELLSEDWSRVVGSPKHYENRKTGAIIELVDLKVGDQISSTRERELAANVDTIFHGVDLQWTFWEALNGRPAGTLAVPNSKQITDNVILLTKAALQSARAKSIVTKDYHYEIERRDAKWNGEFQDPYNFPPHGMAERSGPAGHELIWEVAEVFSTEKKLTVPHNYEVKGATPEEDSLQLKPFDLSQFAHKIVDPSVQVVIQKNGPKSYDFGMNPRSKEIVDKIAPKRVVIYGVATDFCVVAAAMTYRSWGYEVDLVTDAIAGIFPDKIAAEFKTMKDAGVRFVTTSEILKEYAPELLEDSCNKGLRQTTDAKPAT